MVAQQAQEESEDSLPCTKEPPDGPCTEPDESRLCPDAQFKIHFNIILPSVSPFFRS
jgi:hypothetical protein